MTIKRITITAYNIATAKAVTNAIKIKDDMVRALKKDSTIDKRFMTLSGIDEYHEGDFIASYKNNNSYLFGLLIRMKEGEMTQIFKTQLKNTTLSLEEIEKELEENVAGTVKNYSYFLLNNEKLIYTSGGLLLKNFETYVNWLLNKDDSAGFGYVFNPIIKEEGEISISDIKSISIADSFFEDKDEFKNITKSFNIFKLGLIESLLSDTRELKEIEAENIISASIQLKIKTKRKNNDQSKKKALTALIKSVDNDDIVISVKDGRKIKGAVYVDKKVLPFETTKSGFPIEAQVEIEMRNFAEGVKYCD